MRVAISLTKGVGHGMKTVDLLGKGDSESESLSRAHELEDRG